MPENLTTTPAASGLEGYNFAYLDEGTKRMVRRALLKAVAIPGYQVPFASREMPMPYGWGTGGIQVTASIIGRDDVLKVIDQGSDDTTNAVSIRRFFERTAAVTTTTHTGEASIIQTRHRIPEQPLREDQIMVYQVPMPEPLRWLEPSEKETRTLHALEEYGIMSIKLYEDIMRHGDIATGFDYPVKVNGRYIMSPSPIPRFDNPKMHRCSFSVPAGKSASTPSRLIRMLSVSTLRITPSRPRAGISAAPSAAPQTPIWTRSSWMTPGRACSSVPIPTIVPGAWPSRAALPLPGRRNSREPLGYQS